jgi:hypothetical protein
MSEADKRALEVWLSRRQQATRYAVSLKTIERWGVDPKLDYPAELDVNGRKRRPLSGLERWERKRVASRS